MSEKTQARFPQTEEEAEEWIEETQKEINLLHERLENLRVAKELSLLTQKENEVKKWQ